MQSETSLVQHIGVQQLGGSSYVASAVAAALSALAASCGGIRGWVSGSSWAWAAGVSENNKTIYQIPYACSPGEMQLLMSPHGPLKALHMCLTR